MASLADKLAGKFIVFDGPDGSGKSTQLRLLAKHLSKLGAAVECVRDPGGTTVGDRIRQVLLDRDNGHISPMCETLLFMASRAQLVHERIRPALAAGKVVLCDRFISATVAYQGAAGVDRQTVLRLGEIAVGGLWPDLTIILDVDPETGMSRAGAPRRHGRGPRRAGRGQRSLFGDRLEAMDLGYHREVQRIFRELGRAYPGKVVHIDGNRAPEDVLKDVIDAVGEALGQ